MAAIEVQFVIVHFKVDTIMMTLEQNGGRNRRSQSATVLWFVLNHFGAKKRVFLKEFQGIIFFTPFNAL